MCVQRDFKTGILYVTIVTFRSSQCRRGITGSTHIRRQLQRHQHITGSFLVPLYRQVDTVVQESQIHTDVPLLLGLPFDGSIRYIGGAIPHTQTGRHTTHRCTPSITTDVGITSLSPSQTQLTVTDDLLQRFKERFVGKAPGSSQ